MTLLSSYERRDQKPMIDYFCYTAGIGIIRYQCVIVTVEVNQSSSKSVSMLDVSSRMHALMGSNCQHVS